MSKVFISIPHSGLKIPEEIKELIAINDFELKNHSDYLTEKIYDIKWVNKLIFDYSRVLVDPNRFCKTEMIQNMSDDGIISKITPNWKKVFKEEPDEESINQVLHRYYFPFHKKIKENLEKEEVKFLIDWHSMWSVWPSYLKDAWIKRSEIILWNRDYTTCSNEQTSFIKEYFENSNYQVAINDPYKGKKIMKEHCHVKWTPWIQIEINRKLYLNEETLEVYEWNVKKINLELTELVKKINSSDLF